MSFDKALKRELRVAFSRRAQPMWFRILKYGIAICLVAFFWESPSFWLWVLGALAVSIGIHLIWRWKTRNWTQPWGGWNDVETSGQRE
ncbi:MAG: hypothetical protein AB7O65_08535 [Candidatus Korobacteraceae bacterium]